MTILQRLAEFVPPLRRWYPITTAYGAPTAKGPDAGEPHFGIDLGTPIGEPIYAIGEGIVREPSDNPGGGTAGNTITIDYGNGIVVLVGHLADVFVRPGLRVKAGDWIGTTGNSGITTGPHTHIEAWQNGRHINPLDLFDWTRDAFDSSVYSSRHGPSQLVADAAERVRTAIAAATLPKTNGTCPAGYIPGNVIEKVVSDEAGETFGPLGIVASVGNWLPGGFDPNLCYERERTVQSFYDAAKAVPQASDLPFADMGEAVVGFVTAILNPENWARILAIVLGFLMTAGGAYMIWQAT